MECDKQYKPLPSYEEMPKYCEQKISTQTKKEKQTHKECIKERMLEIVRYDKKYVGCLADCEQKFP